MKECLWRKFIYKSFVLFVVKLVAKIIFYHKGTQRFSRRAQRQLDSFYMRTYRGHKIQSCAMCGFAEVANFAGQGRSLYFSDYYCLHEVWKYRFNFEIFYSNFMQHPFYFKWSVGRSDRSKKSILRFHIIKPGNSF